MPQPEIKLQNLAAQTDEIFTDSRAAIKVANRTLREIIAAAAVVLADALAAGGKILICGNGGSAADSIHFSAELLNKFAKVRLPLAAISLTTDMATLTSISNDESYDMVFAKQITALAGREDVLVAITTSGNSPNIMRAVQAAQAKNIKCIVMNGKDGGELNSIIKSQDINIIVPSNSTARIQEIHGIIIHIFCQLIDYQLFGE